MKNGIASRIAIIFSSLLIIAAGTTGYMVYQEARKSLMDSSTERLAQAAEVIRVRLQAGVEAIGKDVDFLTSTPPVDGIVRARVGHGLDPETALLDTEWRKQLTEIFHVFLQNRPSYLRACFVELRHSDRPLVVVNHPGDDRDQIPGLAPAPDLVRSFLPADTALTREAVYLSDIDLIAGSRDSDAGALPVMHATMPVFDAAGTLFGAVTVSIDLRTLLSTLSSLVGPDKTLFIANDDGELLSPPEGPYSADRTGRTVREAFATLKGPLQGVRILNQHPEAGGEQKPGVAYLERLRYDPQNADRQLNVAVVSPHDLILRGVNSVERRSVLIVLLFSIGGAVLALGFSRFLTAPLSRITGAVSRFGEGGSRVDLPVRRSDEIGVLARAFDTMASQIHDQMAVLEDKERRQRIILETAAEGIIVADAGGFIEVYNPAAERLFGYKADEIVGGHISVLLPGYDHDEESTPEGGKSWRDVGTGHDAIGRRKSGDEVAVSLSVSAFTVAQQDRYALFVMDITERKEYETALQEAKEEAEEMARLKTNFLASMSHEIRTPLTAVIGFAGMLANELPDRHGRFAHVIERSGRRLMDTLNAVLSLAQLESQQTRVDLDCLDVAREVEEVVQFFEPHATEKGLDLRCVITAAAQRPHAQLDRGALGSVLQNLIGNAIKFTDRGFVEVRVDADEEQVRIRVKDTGVGIQESFVPYLFDAFRQESSGMARSHEGSGLGLALTKRLVDLMNGDVSVESTKGEGTTFTIAFPRAHVEREEEQEEEDADRGEASDEGNHVATPAWGQTQILVVDDNMETAFLVRNVLADLADVTLAFDSAEALRKLERTRYDLVLLDINLGSGASGVDVLEELRTRPAYRKIPVVALTAYALPGDRERFLQMGFDDYVSKPFTPDALERRIYRALRQPASNE